MIVGDDEGLLDFFQEPVFVLAAAGAILQANVGAKRLTGGNTAGRNLSDLVSSPEADLRTYLRRCSGTTTPLVGSLTFRGQGGDETKFRTYGARLPDSGDPVRIALRCVATHRDGFSLLAKQIRDLNAENRERQRVQAVLEEALVENQILLRELHHRAKNNIQVMHGLFSAAQRETGSEEVRRYLEGANRRLLAMGAAQQLMYQTQQMRVIPVAEFINALCEAVGSTLGPEARLKVRVPVEGNLSNEKAFPLALILNELLTNAFKHGLNGDCGTISVVLRKLGGEFELVVHDSGSGFLADDHHRRSSGLGLVRGLCRQIGGQLSVENDNGARVTVKFSDDPDQN